jgi:hypothetical protein
VGGTEKSRQKRKEPAGSLLRSSWIQVFALSKEGDLDKRDRMPWDLEVNLVSCEPYLFWIWVLAASFHSHLLCNPKGVHVIQDRLDFFCSVKD